MFEWPVCRLLFRHMYVTCMLHMSEELFRHMYIRMLHTKYAGLLFITWQSQNTNCRKQPRMPVIREKFKDFTSLCVEQCTAFRMKSLFKFVTLRPSVFFGRKHILWDRFQCRFHAVVSYCVLLRCRATQTKPCFCFYQIPCDLSSKSEMHCLSVEWL